jgi:hypothetical protein
MDVEGVLRRIAEETANELEEFCSCPMKGNARAAFWEYRRLGRERRGGREVRRRPDHASLRRRCALVSTMRAAPRRAKG